MKCRYGILNDKGRYESWTGIFKNQEDAEKWYSKFGVQDVAKGRSLKLFTMSEWKLKIRMDRYFNTVKPKVYENK